MGRRHRTRGRAIDGVALLDKPLGWSSSDSVQRVKRLFGARKVGHTGTLDVLATGVLPLCFGEATKFSNFGLNANKSYEVVAKLGTRTVSGDGDGEIIAQAVVPGLTEAAVETVLETFRGEIQQIPSMYSAIKHEGKPLYKFARAGIDVERKPRRVTIFENMLRSLDGDELKLRITCSKGTYVRTLVDDIGVALGCGAFVSKLRRIQAGNFHIDDCLSFEQLVEAKADARLNTCLRPIETLMEGWNSVKLPHATAYLVRQGQAVVVPQCAPPDGWVKLFETTTDDTSKFIGIGEIASGKVAPRRLVS